MQLSHQMAIGIMQMPNQMAIGIIAIFNVFLYWRTLGFDIVMDDIQHYDNIKNGKCMKTPIWRPAEFIAERLYGGGTFGCNPAVDHLFTFALWNTLCILAYVAFGADTVAFAAAMMIACHPFLHQLSMWLNGRRYLVCAILLMLAIITGPAGVVFYALASVLQATIIFAPIMMLGKSPIMWLGIPAIGVIIWTMLPRIRGFIKHRQKMIYGEDLKVWKPTRPIIIVKLYGFYFWRIFFPGRVAMSYSFLQMFGRTKEGNNEAYRIDFNFVKGILALVCSGGIIFLLPAEYRFYGVFSVIALLQWCAVIPVTQLVADRYAGITTILMCFFIAKLSFLYMPATAAWALIAFLVGQYVFSTLTVIQMYRNIDAWYDYHTLSDPGNLAVSTLEIARQMSMQRPFQANALLERAMVRYPNDYALNFLGYMSAMILQNPVIARLRIDICKRNIYLGEEAERKGEIEDAETAINAVSGQMTMHRPSRPHGR